MQGPFGVLQIDDTLVYFVYGLVFFSLGLAVALHSRERSQLDLARHLTWLAAFGFAHGLHEWAHVFIPIQAAHLPSASIGLLNATRIALLALSFFFLAQFGVLVALPECRLRRLLRLAFGGLLAAWLAWALGLVGNPDAPSFVNAEVWARRGIGAPGAALSALGMLRQARSASAQQLPNISRDFRVAALSFGAYAFVAGLMVPLEDPLAAQWPSYRLKVELLGLPAPVLRSITGLGVVVGIVRGLRIFEIEIDRRLERAERARFEGAERARNAMEAMAVAISEHRDLGRLLDAALGQVMELTGSRSGWLMLSGRGKGRVELRAQRGLAGDGTALAEHVPRKEECPCLVAMARGEAAAFSASERCRIWPGEAPTAGWASVPLMAHGRPVGVMHLVDGDFTPEMLALLASLGRQLGLAVENAELAEEVARKEAARAQLLRKVITAQEEERKRVARELHDQTGQSLTAVIMALGAAREGLARAPRRVSCILDEAREVAVGALGSTRELIMDLRPAALDDLGLGPAVRRLAEELSRKGDVDIAVETGGLDRRLPGEVELAAFRILQESLHNVVRHSGARHASVQIGSNEEELRAEVADDGVGFDLAEATARLETGRGLGLLGMVERAGLLGGEVVVDSAPGRGTRVVVRIPLDHCLSPEEPRA